MNRQNRDKLISIIYPPPTLQQFVEKTISFKLHDWQKNHLIPLLESCISSPSLARSGGEGAGGEVKRNGGQAAPQSSILNPQSSPEPIAPFPLSLSPFPSKCGAPRRILIHAPPQYGKSIILSKRFPAWALGINPKLRIVLAGYNVEHAAAFAEINREIMSGPSYKQMFPLPHCRIRPNSNRERFSTVARKNLRDGQESITAVGLLSGFTGKGADILIIDDPYASPDAARSPAINERVWRWWTELAKVRIDDNTTVIVMFHRYHEDDLAGRLLAEGGWAVGSPSSASGEERGLGGEVNNPPSPVLNELVGPALDEPEGEERGSGGEVPSILSAPSIESIPSKKSIRSTTTPELQPHSGRQKDSDGESRVSGTSRPNNPNAPVVGDQSPLSLVPCPLSLNDPSPVTRHPSPAPGGWLYLRFPAIADENEDNSDPTGRKPGELLSPRRSRAYLREIEDNDPMTWLGQFQGRPRAPEGAFIRREWLQEIPPSQIPPLKLWIRFWDLATKADQRSDFFSGALLGIGPDQTLYLRDIVRFREEWPNAREIIAETTRKDSLLTEGGAQYEVGVEKVAWMKPMIQELFEQPIFKTVRLTPVRPEGDKKERASGWVSKARNGMFVMIKDHWNQDFISECLAFDGLGTTHDDQVDSVSGAYALLWDVKGAIVETAKVPVEGSLDYYKELARLNGWGLNNTPNRDPNGLYFADDDDSDSYENYDD